MSYFLNSKWSKRIEILGGRDETSVFLMLPVTTDSAFRLATMSPLVAVLLIAEGSLIRQCLQTNIITCGLLLSPVNQLPRNASLRMAYFFSRVRVSRGEIRQIISFLRFKKKKKWR